MEGLGLALMGAAMVMSPLALYVLWRSALGGRQDAEALAGESDGVDRGELLARLDRGLQNGEQQVREREATGATPQPTFYRGRQRAAVERAEPRKYM